MSTYVDRIPTAPREWGEESIAEYRGAQAEARAIEQRLDALAIANSYRSVVARERARIAALGTKAGALALAEIVETATDPALLSGRVLHYLGAVRYWGRFRSLRVARQAGIRDDGLRLRNLTREDRAALAEALRGAG